MNKLLKGSIAGAAGIALLMGGAGTFALWNNTASVAGGTVSAGTLSVASPTAGTWSVTSKDDVVTSNVNIGTFRIVPGDVVTYTKSLTIAATGDNLKAKLTIDPASITASTAAADVELKRLLLLPGNSAVAVTGTGIAAAVPAPGFTVATGTTSATVTVTLKFPNGVAGAENGAKNGVVSLTDLGVVLAQY